MAFFSEGDLVWLRLQKVNDFDVPIGATVKSVDALGMLLTDDEGQEHFLTGSSLGDVQAMHPSCLSAVDDMIQLGELSEAGILRNLFIRYYGQKIYAGQNRWEHGETPKYNPSAPNRSQAVDQCFNALTIECSDTEPLETCGK
ncbi:PREDICTED: unconventional myosin-VIIa-like [Acropora digitifera]|uniref:unconventional myosin-VIIa-like n=1 Tax=Acropora digitifera TaxID=70779 RepID=UPI00077AE78B|nr:PREDICTED: unconventional myosin-VIIa-like [Acropora digitifera]